MTTPASTIDTNASQISYAAETTWGTLPATTFKALRYTGESLAMSKTRTRPTEINSNREAIQAVTTAVTAGGAINYALSYQTFDDLIASALNSTWQSAQTIAGAAGDIAIAPSTGNNATLTAGAGKWTNVNVGSWIRTLGFTNASNNNFWYVVSKTTTVLTLNGIGPSPAISETPSGTNAQVRARNITNGTVFNSVYLQQKYSSTLWLRYPGCYVTGWTLTGGVGQMLTGSFNILAQQELSATGDASTGGITVAPSGSIMNPIAGFGGVYFNESSVGIVDSFTINVQSQGAQLEYGMGSAAAQGLMQGNLEVTGSVKLYFQNFTLYSQFIAETQGRLSIVARDSSGNAYVIQIINAFLNNAKIDSGNVNSPVYAVFDLEGNPNATSGATTISVDELAAT